MRTARSSTITRVGSSSQALLSRPTRVTGPTYSVNAEISEGGSAPMSRDRGHNAPSRIPSRACAVSTRSRAVPASTDRWTASGRSLGRPGVSESAMVSARPQRAVRPQSGRPRYDLLPGGTPHDARASTSPQGAVTETGNGSGVYPPEPPFQVIARERAPTRFPRYAKDYSGVRNPCEGSLRSERPTRRLSHALPLPSPSAGSPGASA